jgi:hypothetical protein
VWHGRYDSDSGKDATVETLSEPDTERVLRPLKSCLRVGATQRQKRTIQWPDAQSTVKRARKTRASSMEWQSSGSPLVQVHEVPKYLEETNREMQNNKAPQLTANKKIRNLQNPEDLELEDAGASVQSSIAANRFADDHERGDRARLLLGNSSKKSVRDDDL